MTQPLVVTMTWVDDCWLYKSVNVAVQVTAETPVTVTVAFGPFPLMAENAALPAQSSDSVKAPV
jgi:hypothetical protein